MRKNREVVLLGTTVPTREAETTRRPSPGTETSVVVLPLGGQGSSLPIPAALPTPLISLGALINLQDGGRGNTMTTTSIREAASQPATV